MSKLLSIAYPYLQKMRFAKLISLFKKESSNPVEKNKILMLSTSKGALGGNLLAIKNYIEKNNLPYNISVICDTSSPEALAKELAVSEFVLIDDFEPIVYALAFRKEQHLVQVWHAMGAFKKFGYARETAEKNSLTHKNYTEAICSSPELTGVYAQSFGIDESKIKPIGTPRTDLFFDDEHIASVKKRLLEKEPLLNGKKICLFAPTFRGNSVNDGFYPEEFINSGELAEQLGNDWAVIIKLHPFIKNKLDVSHPRVFDLSDEREINDILFITDVLVTDYSSVIFENAIIGNAAVLYAPDLENYVKNRGFYFDYGEYACGEIITEKENLAQAIKTASAADERMKTFKKRFVSLCDGKSSERFVKDILEDKYV